MGTTDANDVSETISPVCESVDQVQQDPSIPLDLFLAVFASSQASSKAINKVFLVESVNEWLKKRSRGGPSRTTMVGTLMCHIPMC